MERHRIIYDWDHNSVVTSITEVNKPPPKKAPPPPRWCSSWGPCLYIDSTPDADLIEDTDTCCVYEYHHGKPPTDFPNPLYTSPKIDEKAEDTVELTELTEATCDQNGKEGENNTDKTTPPAGKPKFKTEIKKIRRPIQKTSPEDELIGQKFSKSRVAVSSRMYARPLKNSKDNGEVETSQENAASPKSPGFPDKKEVVDDLSKPNSNNNGGLSDQSIELGDKENKDEDVTAPEVSSTLDDNDDIEEQLRRMEESDDEK